MEDKVALGEKFDRIIPDDAAASRFVTELYAFCEERGVDANIGYFTDGAEVYGFVIHTKRSKQYLMKERCISQVKPQ